jgi:outer membrane protein TolC
MKSRYLLLIPLLSRLAMTPARGDRETNAVSAPAPLTADAVVAEALRSNPALKAARANLEAMQARVPQALAWQDPQFGIDAERMGTTRFGAYSDNEWMLSQRLPLSGRNRLQAAAASAEAGAALAEWRRRMLEVTVRARVAFVSYANLHRQLDLNRETEALLGQFVESLRARFQSGAAMPADVLLAETELVRLVEARRDLERQLSDAVSQLNVAMNRPAQSPLPEPARLEFRELPLDLAAMQAAALAHRPEIESAQRRAEAARSRVGVARRAWVPDPELRVEARQYDNGGKFFDEYDTGIFFNIPWVNRGKYRSAIHEAEKALEAAEQDLEAVRAETAGRVRDQLKKIETFHHHYTLFRDRLLPLARQTAEASRAAYVSGRSTVLEVITALRTVRDVDAAHQQHLADYLSALAELEAVVGIAPGASGSTPK